MTLNDIEWSFYVKILSELGIQWVGVLAFGDNCSEICRTAHYIVSGKNVAHLGTVAVLVIIRVMELFNGITEPEASNQ